MTRKKKPEPKKPVKATEKPARDLTTHEVMDRLFPKGLIDAARERLEPRPRPGFEEQ